MNVKGTIVLAIFFFCSLLIHAQEVIINELMPSNSFMISDEDGDFSDWIELFNTQDSSINLAGYGISDDSENLFKWVLPELNLSPKDHLLIFASDKNRTSLVKHWETIINWGADWKYLLGTAEPLTQWKNNEFNDAAWSSGSSGFGYGDGDDATIVPVIQSVYIRKVFNIENINDITASVLHVDYDDAFVAYLNGVEIARANIGSVNISPPYNQSADAAREGLLYQGGLPEVFIINNFQSILQQGENVLAIQVHNYGTNSSDMTLIPFLSLGMSTVPQNAFGTNPILQLPNKYLHTNFKLDDEELFITNPLGITKDSISTSVMVSDISFGRQPDGTDSWFYFDNPTPGDSNITSGYNGIASDPEFSVAGGFHSGLVNISLSSNSTNYVIRYTLDGSLPQETSTLYTQPVQINSTKVLRARTFSPGFIPSKTVTNTYLIIFSTQLPVFSISTDPANFFDEEIGIYAMGDSAETSYPYFGANFWKDWEKPVHIELFDNNDSGFSVDAGIKIFGAWSRALPQKSLAFFARSGYGSSEINYQLFPELPFTEYESFVLRNSGNDWGYTMFRDGLMTSLVDGVDIDKPDFRPAILFLNGEYWGIHNLREKINENFLELHHNVDRDSIDMLENAGTIVTGDNLEYMDLFSFIENNNLSVPANYEYVKSRIEVENFIKYHVSQIYFDNTDWPGNNIKYWKEKSTGKWRWIMYDTDFGFSLYNAGNYQNNTLNFATESNGPDWPNPPWSTLFLRKLLANQSFRNDFINCVADLLNSNFLPANVVKKINSIKENFIDEIPRHINRWQPFDFTGWNNNVQQLINFANQRPYYLRLHIVQKFGLPGEAATHITISDTSMGSVKLNSLELNIPNWSGSYFLNVPIQLLAKPKRGFRFVRWEGSHSTTEDSITIIPNGIITLNAVFEIDPFFGIPKIVINEINYNSIETFNPQDWIEFYNNGDTSVNISGWIFEDSDSNTYIIPESTILGADEYLILCSDDTLFHPLFPDVQNYLGNFTFGLSGGGELLKLRDSEGNIIDSLTYDDTDPWPNADGTGSTLSLINPNLENHLPESWAASLSTGTPGRINDVYVDDVEETHVLPKEYALMQNYPNPFNPVTNIKYSVPEASDVSVKIYDILGNEIKTLVNEIHQPGFYNVIFNASEFSSGVYFYRILANNFISTKKLILLK